MHRPYDDRRTKNFTASSRYSIAITYRVVHVAQRTNDESSRLAHFLGSFVQMIADFIDGDNFLVLEGHYFSADIVQMIRLIKIRAQFFILLQICAYSILQGSCLKAAMRSDEC